MDPGKFSVARLRDYCIQSVDDLNGEVNIPFYLKSWQEILLFFNTMGSVFNFLTSDVKSKMNTVQTSLDDDQIASHYQYIGKMLKYELDNDLIDLVHYGKLSGARQLLRLHRAFKFVALLLQGLETSLESDNSHKIASKSYEHSLAPYHTWLIRHTVYFALRALPSRKTLFLRLFGDREETDAKQELNSAVDALNRTYELTNSLYDQLNLLDIP